MRSKKGRKNEKRHNLNTNLKNQSNKGNYLKNDFC